MFDEVDSTTMTVRPYRTMLPPIWVAACADQRRRNAELRKTAAALGASASRTVFGGPMFAGFAHGAVTGGERVDRGGQGRIAVRDEPGEASLDRGPRQEHMTTAGLAAQAEVGSKAVHEPRVAAAWVRPAQANDVAEQERRARGVGHRAGQGIKGGVDHGSGRDRARSPAAPGGPPG